MGNAAKDTVDAIRASMPKGNVGAPVRFSNPPAKFQSPPTSVRLAIVVDVMVINEIERIILLRLLNTWIRRLYEEKSKDITSPAAPILCDLFATESDKALELTKGVESDLMPLLRTDSGSQFLSDTLTALSKQLVLDTVDLDKLIEHSRPRRRTPLEMPRLVDFNERIVLITHLKFLQKQFEAGPFNKGDAYGALNLELAVFRQLSTQRAESVFTAYAVSKDRDSVSKYYMALVTEMTDNPRWLMSGALRAFMFGARP